MSMATAPESRIGRRPQPSTRYHGGMVDSKYEIPLIPVIRIASRPAQPAYIEDLVSIILNHIGICLNPTWRRGRQTLDP